MIVGDLDRLPSRGVYSDFEVRAVGWLGHEEFAKKEPSQEFLDALFRACREPVMKTRGFQPCMFCLGPPRGPIRVSRRGETIALGSAQIRISGLGRVVYAAPTLIYHYSAEHLYSPPSEFVEAVLREYGESS